MGITVYEFKMGDVEDPYLYAAAPLHEWLTTASGRWVMDHALQPPSYYCNPDLMTLGYKIVVTADFNAEDETWFKLTYG